MSEKLQITTFGGLSIQLDGQPLTDFASRKVEALLVYLACTGRSQRREALAELLWEERSQERAMGNLRVALTSLRKELDDFVLIDRETVTINPGADVWLDTAELEAMLAAGTIEGAVALYQGPFLEGFYMREARGFEDWVSGERGRLERLVLDALSAQVARDLEIGAFRLGIEHASQLLRLDPLREEAHHKLMLLLACSGQRSAALAQYGTCRGALMDELGVEPSPELQEIYNLLAKGERPPGIPEVPSARERRLEAIGECPYRGLAAFREADAPFFFGRGAFTERLHEAVVKQPMVAVIVGSSGSGKSSAVYAGLLPRLREGGGWLISDFRPGSDPFQSLSSTVVNLLEPDLGEADRLVETGKITAALKGGEISLSNIVDRLFEKRRDGKRLLLVADQFEELYTLCPEAETRRRYLDVLLEAVEAANGLLEPHLVLLLTLRADFMGQALAYRPFADALQEAALILGPMNRDELRTAIEKPAELQGAAFEAGLVERLLDDVGQEPGNLPLLEFALTLLWKRISYGWMTHAGYEEIGRVEGALARYAGQVYEGLDPDEQEAARQVFVQLVRPGEGTEDTRRVASRAEVGEGNWELVQRLADRRLVVTGRDPGGSETVEVVHEALIQGWGRLREWIEADRAFRTWQERLRANLHQWRESREDQGALLRGAPLAEAEGWGAERGDELSQAEKEYIQAGVALREQRQMARERRRRRVMVGLAVGLIVALALALLAGLQWQRADTASELAVARQAAAQAASTLAIQGQEQAAAQGATAQAASTLAVAQQVTAESNAEARATAQAIAEDQEHEARRQAAIGLANAALREIDTGRQDIGVLLALEALENYPYTWQAEQALGQAVLQSRLQLVLPHEHKVNTVAFSPDGKYILTGSSDWTARVWDAASGQELFTMQHDDIVYFAQWSPDGTRIITDNGESGQLVLWDGATGERLHTLDGHTSYISMVRWSPSGDRILSSSVDVTARIWDAQTGQELFLLAGHEGMVNRAEWSPSGDQVITTGDEGTAIIWNATTGERVMTLTGHTNIVEIADWSPSGDRILTASWDGTVKIWDADTGEEQLTITIEEEGRGEFVWAAWSPSGDRILAGPYNGLGSKVYDAATGAELLALYPGRKMVWNCGFAWSPSGEYILTGSGESSATVWDAATGDELFTLRGHNGALTGASEPCIAWSPDGTRATTMSQDGTAMVWDAKSIYTLAGHTDTVVSAYWSPSENRILTAAYDGTARVWDVASGLELMSVDYGARGVSSARWSPSGGRFVIGARTMANVWDAATGAELFTISIPDHQRLVTADWSSDGELIATGHDFDTSIRLWDANTGKPLQLLGVHTDATGRGITEVRWSPSGDRILSACTDFTLKVWDPLAGEELYTLDVFQGPVIAAAWSPSGERIGTYSKDGFGRIWDAENGKLILEFSGHTGETWALTWSPSGKRIITGSSDGTARVWDVATGLQVLHYPIGSPVSYIDWSLDGRTVLIPYDDKVVMLPIWQTTQELIDYAYDCCVVRELSPEDRELYGLPPAE